MIIAQKKFGAVRAHTYTYVNKPERFLSAIGISRQQLSAIGANGAG